jgi:hypothetical protein
MKLMKILCKKGDAGAMLLSREEYGKQKRVCLASAFDYEL